MKSDRWFARNQTKRRGALGVRLGFELLEPRNLLDAALANVLVNDPTADQPWLVTFPDGSTQMTAGDTQSETALVLGANSRVVVAFNDSNHLRPSFLQPPAPEYHATGYSLSTDKGDSFADKGSLPDSVDLYMDVGDPVLARSSKTGTIFLATVTGIQNQTSYIGDRLNVYRSLNNGVSFRDPVNGTPGFVAGVDQQDKDWIAVDNFPGPGYGNVYLAWTDISSNPAHGGIMFTRSTDDGLTWGPSGGTPIKTPGASGHVAAQDAYVTVGPDHAVYVFWWDQTKSPYILMRKSTDQGVTFGDTVIVTGLRTHGPNGDLGLTDGSGRWFRSGAPLQAAINPVTGDIYVAFADEDKGSADRANIYFTQSTDGGLNWSKPVQINDDPTANDQWQPALAVTPDGSHLGVFWYDRRLDPANNLIDRYGVIGSVSGSAVSFGANLRITDVSFPPAFEALAYFGTGYMGDYDQAVADNGFFYTTWGDNRLANPNYPPHENQPDVRFAKVPVDWQGTSASLLVSASLSTSGAPLAAPSLAPDHVAAPTGSPSGRSAAMLADAALAAMLNDRPRTPQNLSAPASAARKDDLATHPIRSPHPAVKVPVAPATSRVAATHRPTARRAAASTSQTAHAVDRSLTQLSAHNLKADALLTHLRRRRA